MAGTMNSLKVSIIAEIFESMEYGPVSDSSSLAKVCALYTYMYMNCCFMCLLTIILKYSIFSLENILKWYATPSFSCCQTLSSPTLFVLLMYHPLQVLLHLKRYQKIA
jgi:hypothetical protein